MDVENFILTRIKDFKKRKPKLLDDTSKYAMQMTIDELQNIWNFGLKTGEFKQKTQKKEGCGE